MTQSRTDLATTKTRVKGSEAKIDSELEPLIKKNYWCAGWTHAPCMEVQLVTFATGYDSRDQQNISML